MSPRPLGHGLSWQASSRSAKSAVEWRQQFGRFAAAGEEPIVDVPLEVLPDPLMPAPEDELPGLPLPVVLLPDVLEPDDPEPDIALFSCTWPLLSLQCVAAEMLPDEPDPLTPEPEPV